MVPQMHSSVKILAPCRQFSWFRIFYLQLWARVVPRFDIQNGETEDRVTHIRLRQSRSHRLVFSLYTKLTSHWTLWQHFPCGVTCMNWPSQAHPRYPVTTELISVEIPEPLATFDMSYWCTQKQNVPLPPQYYRCRLLVYAPMRNSVSLHSL